MYRKVLVPLDRSEESERVIPLLRKEIAQDGELVLLHVIRPAKTMVIQDYVVDSSEQEEEQRADAMKYLEGVIRRHGGDPSRWRCEVMFSDSVPKAIASCAERHKADVIAMYTHDRKGLAKLLRGSVTQEVQRLTAIEVKAFRPAELVRAA